jgi:hypothetical protein
LIEDPDGSEDVLRLRQQFDGTGVNMENIRRDFGYAARQLRTSAGFTCAAAHRAARLNPSDALRAE